MFYVYILTNRKRGTLYVGITNNPAARIHLHRTGLGSSFVRKYRLYSLVWVGSFSTAIEAIIHEKRLKKWRRTWKIELIEKQNPQWRDLYNDLPF